MDKKVWINGSFDILHIGHIKLFEYASSFGSIRVGTDSDRRIKEKKGSKRPFNNLQDRIEFLKAIKYVTDIVTFDSDEELTNEIKKYTPDIMIIGNDYTYESIIGRDYIPEIKFFQKIPNKSTTQILNNG
jgi:D-beta-D-heptose 7-phosphate kinase/D-beta-D-heptose 1-phosphate adenosyltransferase